MSLRLFEGVGPVEPAFLLNPERPVEPALRDYVTPDSVKLWTAASPTKDFRESEWTSQTMKSLNMPRKEDRFRGEIPLLPGSHRALFAEALYHFDGLDYSISTQLRRE